MSEPTNHELSERIAVLEERMNTSYERLRADMASWKTDMATDMARRDTEMADWKIDMAKRENRQLLTILGGLAVATTILGVLIAGIPAT